MRMRAVGEAAQMHERPKLREEAFDLLRHHVPQLNWRTPGVSTTQPPKSSRINSVVVVVMLALLIHIADLAHPQPQLG